MKAACIVMVLMGLLGCSAGGGDDPDVAADTPKSDQSGVDALADRVSEETNEQPDTQAPPIEYPKPPNPVPMPDSGTYSWTDGTNKVVLAINDGMVFLLESSFGCTGTTGCKVKQEFARLTCNKAFEKGYHSDIVEGEFVLEGVKTSDRLVGAILSPTTVGLVYELTPTVSCCSATFALDATWGAKEDCAEYANPDCDVFTDTHCQDGFNCVFGANDKPVCMLAGEAAVGEKCTMQTQCADGVCIAFQDMDGEHCLKYCKLDSDCGYGKSCMGVTGHSWKVCSLSQDQFEQCNLLQQNCSKPGEACYMQSSSVGKPVCLKAGAGEKGDACGGSSDCAPGLDCIATKKCLKICNTEGGEPSCDSPFTACVPNVGWQKAGYCDE